MTTTYAAQDEQNRRAGNNTHMNIRNPDFLDGMNISEVGTKDSGAGGPISQLSIT